MKRQVTLYALVAIMAALLAPLAWGQTGASFLHGITRDGRGDPLAGGILHLVNKENGRKYDNIKTNKRGEFTALGIQPGTYTVTLTKDGQLLYQLASFRMLAGENVLNIDLKREQAQAVASITPEERKALEEQEKELAKIKGLNDKLAAAKAAQEAGNPQQAVQILAEAAQIDANQPVIWATLADAERGMAKAQADPTERKATYARAIEDYKKAIAIKPSGAYYNNMGDALARMGDYDGAIATYEQAAALDPPNAAIYYFNEGAVLTNAGKVDLANVAFDKAIAADPGKAEAYYQKGVNLLGKATIGKDGKMIAPPEAEQALNKYLELAPNGPNAEAAKQLLATLGVTIETSFGKAKTTKKK